MSGIRIIRVIYFHEVVSFRTIFVEFVWKKGRMWFYKFDSD